MIKIKGVFVAKAKIANEDNRRKLIVIENGQIPIKNLKILVVKEDSYLGGHYHQYLEVMYIIKGNVKNYKMKNLDTGEEETFELTEGDVVFRTGRIVHGGMFEKGSIVIDGATETYISQDFNDIPFNIDCPCEIECIRHGNCIPCKEHHHSLGQKTACEKLK